MLQQEQINGILVTRLGPGIREIDEVFTRMMALTTMPGAAYVLCYQGRLVYAAGFGYSNLEDKIPFTPYTLCEIGSVSKPVASMAILRLLDEGVRLPDSSRLAIDSHPYDILGWRAPDGSLPEELRRVTVKHALNHEMLYKHAATREEAAQALGKNINDVVVKDLHIASLKEGLAFEPGSKSQYSGVGQCVMARTTEKLTNTRFDMYLRETTFAPLGIQDAFSFNYYDIASGVLPPSYQWNAQRGEFVREEFPPPAAIGYADAVGSLVMSPLSLARFGDRFLDLYRDPVRMERMIIDNKVAPHGGYALGWIAERLEDGSFDLYHGGMIGGWRTELKTGWYGFSHVWVFNAGPDAFNIIPEPLGRPAISDDTFGKTGIPRELFPPELQNILKRLRPRLDRQRQVNLWRQAGFPD
ncbi:MAG: beta-lactamase family protein [Chthonomonadales bacterium]|nr:beta-lactamase family protein [Chthonomonadales bacterium]